MVRGSIFKDRGQFFYGWVIVIAAFFALFSIGVPQSFGVFFKPLIDEFGWGRAATSLASSINMAVCIPSVVLVSMLFDKYGPRVAIGCCGFLLGLGTVLCSQISSLWQLYVFYGVIAAIGLGGIYAPCVSMASKWFIKMRGLVMGIVISGTGIGTLFTSPLTAYLIANYGWRSAFAILGVAYGTLIVVASLMMRRDPEELGLQPLGAVEAKLMVGDPSQELWTAREALKTKSFWVLFVTYALGSISVNIVTLHVVPFATDIGILEAVAAGALGFSGGCRVIGMIGMGSLSDVMKRKRVVTICYSLLALAMVSLPMVRDTWMLYAFAAVFGFSTGGFIPVFAAITRDLFGQASTGTIYSAIVIGWYSIGGVLGPFLGGYIFDVSGSYYTAFLFGAMTYVVGIVGSFLIETPKKRPHDRSVLNSKKHQEEG